MNLDKLNLVFVDVEATGPTPCSGVMTQFGAVHYASRETFHGVLYDSKPSDANPAVPVLTGNSYPGQPVMEAFSDWLLGTTGSPLLSAAGRGPIFVSDNNGFDFMWIAFYFDRYAITNPFGHSSRRISDFYAGLVGDFTKSQGWKKWRVTPHDHHPVHDALGNVEAFARMIGEIRPP